MSISDYSENRRAMIDSQLRTSGVTAPWVIAAMGALPRESFAPAQYRAVAYMDRSITLGGGRAMNPPLATGMMLQHANITPQDNVLLIGAGTGYVAALLAQRAGKVVAVEETPALFALAQASLSTVPNVALVHANLTEGAAQFGPYSVIIIDGAVGEIPVALLAQLQDGGRIITGVMDGKVSRIAHGIARGGTAALRPIADGEIAALPMFAAKKEFVF
jgi:protein-L-isoaspartate(D-aspartate) O-methyltransferase